jgi:hypothetical protein
MKPQNKSQRRKETKREQNFLGRERNKLKPGILLKDKKNRHLDMMENQVTRQ